MLFNMAMVAICAFVLYMLFERIRIPGILGMILAGILLGPSGWNAISPRVLEVSADLRSIALIVILIRVSLNIKRSELNAVGPVSIRMGIIPLLLETSVIALLAIYIFHFSISMALMLGFIASAVAPAIIVPQMMDLKNSIPGDRKHIPTIVLAGTAVDNIVAIALCGALIQIHMHPTSSLFSSIIHIPLGMILGALVGIILGYAFIRFFKRYHVRDTKKAIVFLLIAMILFHVEHMIPIPISGLIAIMAMGFIILEKYEVLAHRLSEKFNKIWIMAELVLFVLVGAQVNLHALERVGASGLLLIGLGVAGRSLGVYLSTRGMHFNRRESTFCIISFIPKATVQAALGAIPLSLGLPHGDIILALAVLSIVVTAPLGALGIRGSKMWMIGK